MVCDSRRTKVLAGVDDLFFSARIESVARGIGVDLAIALDSDQLWSMLHSDVPDLLILDLNSKSCEPLDTIRRIKSDGSFTAMRVIGFLSHVQADLEKAAREAGCDLVLPRSKFTARLSQILQLRISD